MMKKPKVVKFGIIHLVNLVCDVLMMYAINLGQYGIKEVLKKVKLYIGIGVYRAGHNTGQNSAERKEWKSDKNVLKNQVKYGRKKEVDGFAFFDYQDLTSKSSSKAVSQLKTVLKK